MLELCRCPNIYGPDCIYIFFNFRMKSSSVERDEFSVVA